MRNLWPRTLYQDLRFSFRQLVKMPGFALTAILSIALGIGATTAVFSVVYAILIDPYPYANADRMAHLRLLTPKEDTLGRYIFLTGSQWQQLRKSPVVEDSFISDSRNETVTGSNLPEDILAATGSSNMFQFLGVPPVLGRGLQPSDAIDGHDPQQVAVLGYTFWQRHFNADRNIVGKTIYLSRKPYLIVGVAAQRFAWNDGDLYIPLKVDGDQDHSYFPEIRLKPGVTHAQADAALQPLIQQFAKETPNNFPPDKIRLHVVGLNESFVQELGGTLYLLFGAVALLLAIGCGNVSILLLARASARQHEFAVRAAIGASRRRIVRQLLTESLLLSVTGAAIGLFLAYETVGLIVSNLPEFSFPHEASIHINVPVLVFSMLVAIGTGVLFGLWPALQLSHPEVSQVMQSTTRRTTGGVAGRRVHGALIAGQIALTLLLLSGAGASIQGFLRLAHRPLGYDPHNVMSVGIPIHEGTYLTWPARSQYLNQLRDQIATVPGVTMAAVSSNATPPSNGVNLAINIQGIPSTQNQTIRLNLVSSEYFPILRIPLVQGRTWNQDENHQAAPLAVVNQSFVKRYFPSGDVLGHTFKLPPIPAPAPFVLSAPSESSPFRIVGVIKDKLDDGLTKPIVPEVFIPDTIVTTMYTQVLVRSEVPPLTLLHPIQLKVNSIDQNQQTDRLSRDLEKWISQEPEFARGRLISILFGAFAALALVLAAVGLYSVVSYTVVQRTNEFGIRVALGAQRTHVLGMVFRSNLSSIGIGIAAGLILTVALNKVMAAWAAESSRDPMLLLGAVAVLAVAATLACALPAWRASGVDPMTAIRYE
jgi:predicted permease